MQHPSIEVCQWLMEQRGLKKADIEKAGKLVAENYEQEILDCLIKFGLVSDSDLAHAWSAVLALPLYANAQPNLPLEGAIAGDISERFLRHHRVVPVLLQNDSLVVVMTNPADQFALDAITFSCKKPLQIWVATSSEIETLIGRYFGQNRTAMGSLVETLDESDSVTDDIEQLKDLASEAPVIRMVNLILQRALEKRASDIHIEPFEQLLKVRYRVDGVLEESEAPPFRSTAAVISRIKIMARLDIAERRLPQDGRIMLRIQGKELDFRVSTVPTSHGESVVMRLLDRDNLRFDFTQLGIDGERLDTLLGLLHQPHGILLVTGPTGSGKTTTLYTALSMLNTTERKIITVEDPVEYQLEGVNQIQVKPMIGLDFPDALRAIVRQDPDVIMIGEMRDLATCRIAIQSSLTGHLVLSTLHTNSAAASMTRLLDMGVESYLVASTLRGILAQRLVRRLDPATRIAYEAPDSMIEELGLGDYKTREPLILYRPDVNAPGGGYQGRSAITELLVMNDELRSLLIQQADAATLERAARNHGLRTLYEDGLRQVVAGITSIDEVLRVAREN